MMAGEAITKFGEESNSPESTEEKQEKKPDWRLEELEAVKTKYENLQEEWGLQQEQFGKLQGEMFKLRTQLQNESAFCASLGSVTGNLLWKASRLQPVVELLLTSNKLTEFFCLVNGTLISFLGTYCKELPDISTDDMQFILSMCGIIANIAAVPEGRQFIVMDSNGKDLVLQIIRLLPNIPKGSGDPLKRIMFMVLYNVSINQTGMLLMQDQKNLLSSISEALLSDKCAELKIMAIRLLEAITSEVPNQFVLNLIQHLVPLQKVINLKNAGDAEVQTFAANILANLETAEKQVGVLSRVMDNSCNEVSKEGGDTAHS